MQLTLAVIAINLALVLPAAVPWLARRLPTLVILTALVAVPLGIAWFQVVDARASIGYEAPRLSMPVMPLEIPLLLLFGSSIVRASTLAHSTARSGFIALLACAVLAVIVIPARLEGAREMAHLETLAQAGHFEVGGEEIELPMIAVMGVGGASTDRLARRMLWGEYVATIRELAADPETPLPVQQIDLRTRDIDPFSERRPLFDFCGRLAREWAQHACRRDASGILSRLPPSRWILLARANFAALKHYWMGGRETMFDQVAEMALPVGVPEIGCDSGTKFCTAAVALTPELVAVWTVWSDAAGETAQQMAERQGRAIALFVRHGLGATENFEELQKWTW